MKLPEASATTVPSSCLMAWPSSIATRPRRRRKPALEFDSHPHRQGLAIADINPGRGTPLPAQEDPVGHHVIQYAEEDAAMGDAFIADAFVVGREFRTADVALQAKADVQAPGIPRTADETPVGGRSERGRRCAGHGRAYHNGVLPITDIKARLAAHEPMRYAPKPGTLQAAVAIVLRERADDTDVLLIKRAEHEGDPWSGDMAFPGGHREPQDADLAEAALRETHEEIGLAVDRANMIGELSQQRPSRRTFDMLVSPFVFFLDGDPSFDLSSEVDAALWSPLAPMHAGNSHDSEHRLIAGVPTPFSGYRVPGGHFVWGLTYRMIETLFEALDPGYSRRL